MEEFEKQKDKYKGKDYTVVCHCLFGGRSGMYGVKLKKEGFQVVNLRYGVIGWAMHGLSFVTKGLTFVMDSPPTNKSLQRDRKCRSSTFSTCSFKRWFQL